VPIQSPNLDDLSFTTVRDLLIRQIPIVAPEWTDHNDSDPGITLIQLFSYLAEQIGFRLNRVPDKNYVEFLKLIGIELRPAEAASTRLEFILSQPETLDGFTLSAGSQVGAKTGKGGSPPPVYETDADLNVVPAQLGALCTTASPDLRNIVLQNDPGVPPGAGYVNQRFTLVWDGKQPKLKDLPGQPLPVFAVTTTPPQQQLWIGVIFNPLGTAGFVAQKVTLTIQFDDDEQPDPNADVQCALNGLDANVRAVNPALPNPPTVAYRYYRPTQLAAGETKGSWQNLNVLNDNTNSWTQSGTITFDVPFNIGPVPDSEWLNVFAPAPMTLTDICNASKVGQGSQPPAPVTPHPLIGAIKSPVQNLPPSVTTVPISGWLNVTFSGTVPHFFIRAVSFNVAPATQALTVRNEVLGRGDGSPGQLLSLANGNILAGTLQLAVADPIDQLLHTWTEVEDFDAAGASDQVYVLDREAGQVVFGDGIHGKPPPDQQQVVALQYRWGGGVAGETGVATITKPQSIITVPTSAQSAVTDVTNIVSALGGKDAETLEEAKARAPKELKVLGRAVTVGDFQFLALQTPGIRVKRAEVVPLRKPFADIVADGPGLDLDDSAPGALSVIIVPDVTGPFPTPTDGMLRKVCQYLDQFRLVTTEVHVVPPMYVRLFNMCITVRARPGYSQAMLRDAIAAHLETYFHVLTGGDDGKGFPFGASLHHADLVAQVFAVPGVATVECAEAWFDTKAPPQDPNGQPVQTWRTTPTSRQNPMHLTGCVVNASQDVTILQLGADENVFVDDSNLTVSLAAG